MATIYTSAESNIRKTWILISLFLLIIIGFGWIFSRAFQNPEILIFAVIFSLLMNVVSFWHSDKIILAITRAKPIKKEDNPELYRLTENLCITAGLPLPSIYILNEAQPNAFAAGRDKNHAVIAVTRGLLEKLDKAELEGVISHELSHIGNKDMLLMTVVVVLAGFLAILSDWSMRMTFLGGLRKRDNDRGGFLMLIGFVLAILAPFAGMLIRLAISRKREFLADASGVLLTRYPEGLATALAKIAIDRTPMKAVSTSTNHLFIANPLKDKSFLTLFSTHPPIEERIAALKRMTI